MRVPEDFLRLLSLHGDCTASLLERAAPLRPSDLEFPTDPELVRIRKMVYSVVGEFFAMCGMVRLKALGDFALYGYLKPRHDVGPDVCAFLAGRFPGTIIALGNSARSWTALYKGQKVSHATGTSLESTIESLKALLSCPGGTGGEPVERLWETYYWSQYAKERRNLRQFHQFMPKKYLVASGLKVESNTGCASLDDFR